jgi:hypothetical protein
MNARGSGAHTATPLQNGDVLIVGGDRPELYTP